MANKNLAFGDSRNYTVVVTNGGTGAPPYQWRSYSGYTRRYTSRDWLRAYPVCEVYTWRPDPTLESGETSAARTAYTTLVRPSIEGRVDNTALSRLANKLADSRSQWQAAVALGEAREVAHTLARTASRIAHGFFAVKRGDLRSAVRHLSGSANYGRRARVSDGAVRTVAKQWMEIQYAWKPLLADIDAAARYLAEKQVTRALRPLRVTASAKAIESRTTPIPGEPASTDVYTDTTSVKYTFELYPRFMREPSTLQELGFTDPATVMWELLPLSFVVDWFVNVGEVLSSLNEFRQWDVLRGLRSSRTVSEYRATRRGRHVDSIGCGGPQGGHAYFERPYYTYVTEGWAERKDVWFDRQTMASLPTSVPLSLTAGNPFAKGTRFANAVALLTLAFTGRKS